MASEIDTSFIDGSCGRRPMMTMSKSRTDIVTMMVVHQTQVGMSTAVNPSGYADGPRSRAE